MTPVDILLLYLAFRVKQVVCDFFLQTAWMASVKGAPINKGGAKALAAHVGIHAAFTMLLMFLFAPAYWWLGVVDFVVHGIIDRVKSIVTNKNGWTYKDNEYWWAFGIDQEAHNLTHLGYIVFLVMVQGGVILQ